MEILKALKATHIYIKYIGLWKLHTDTCKYKTISLLNSLLFPFLKLPRLYLYFLKNMYFLMFIHANMHIYSYALHLPVVYQKIRIFWFWANCFLLLFVTLLIVLSLGVDRRMSLKIIMLQSQGHSPPLTQSENNRNSPQFCHNYLNTPGSLPTAGKSRLVKRT